ncbi:hypothetical protein DFQ26_001616, partial [Actinomortierella ambigua]
MSAVMDTGDEDWDGVVEIGPLPSVDIGGCRAREEQCKRERRELTLFVWNSACQRARLELELQKAAQLQQAQAQTIQQLQLQQHELVQTLLLQNH